MSNLSNIIIEMTLKIKISVSKCVEQLNVYLTYNYFILKDEKIIIKK